MTILLISTTTLTLKIWVNGQKIQATVASLGPKLRDGFRTTFSRDLLTVEIVRPSLYISDISSESFNNFMSCTVM